MVASGPAGPRRRLGTELRKLRNGAGLHLDEVAQALGCSTSKVSRLETGKGVPKASDVRQMIRLYGRTTDDEQETLLQLVRDSRAEGWWTTYTDGVAPERFFLDVPGRYAALETDAVALRTVDVGPLDGLLQIPDDLGSDLVYIEGHAGETFLEGESDVDLYREVFDDALARSLDAGASREAVRRSVSRFAAPGRSLRDRVQGQ